MAIQEFSGGMNDKINPIRETDDEARKLAKTLLYNARFASLAFGRRSGRCGHCGGLDRSSFRHRGFGRRSGGRRTFRRWFSCMLVRGLVFAHILGRRLAFGLLGALVHEYLPVSHADEQSALAEHGTGRTESAQALSQRAGFTEIVTDWVGYNHTIDTPEEFWELQRTFSSLARKRINEAPLEKVNALREAFMSACRRTLASGGKLVYPVGALIISARKPGTN